MHTNKYNELDTISNLTIYLVSIDRSAIKPLFFIQSCLERKFGMGDCLLVPLSIRLKDISLVIEFIIVSHSFIDIDWQQWLGCSVIGSHIGIGLGDYVVDTELLPYDSTRSQAHNFQCLCFRIEFELCH